MNAVAARTSTTTAAIASAIILGARFTLIKTSWTCAEFALTVSSDDAGLIVVVRKWGSCSCRNFC
jgi:hypothetical protein